MAKQLDFHTIKQIFLRFQKDESEPRGELDHVNVYTLLVAVALSASDGCWGEQGDERAIQNGRYAAKMLDLGEEGLIEHTRQLDFIAIAKNVMRMAQILDDYAGVVPDSRAALEALPG